MNGEHGRIDNETQSVWLKEVTEAVERKSFVKRSAPQQTVEAHDVAATVPREYICPISLELMKDPVLLVETGQVYDRSCIEEWFMAGKKSCPVSRTELKHMLLSPIFPLRSAIQNYAKEHDIEYDSLENISETDTSTTTEISLSGRMFDGVSVYDVYGLCQMVDASDAEQQATALKLLVEMWRFGNTCQRKKLNRMLPKDKLASVFLDSETETTRIHAARLLLHLPGRYFDVQRQLKLLKHNDLVLQEEVLMRLWKYAYRHQSRMRELASLMKANGADEIISICRNLANPTENTEISDEIKTRATFLLVCATFRRSTRNRAINQGVVPLLVNFLQSTINPGFKFCLMKALQYMSKDSDGGNQIIRAGGVRMFIEHLPARNNSAQYYTRIYLDWFAWVTVAETVVKTLYWLAFETQGLMEMRTAPKMNALRIVAKHRSLPDICRTRYLTPLLNMLSENRTL